MSPPTRIVDRLDLLHEDGLEDSNAAEVVVRDAPRPFIGHVSPALLATTLSLRLRHAAQVAQLL